MNIIKTCKYEETTVSLVLTVDFELLDTCSLLHTNGITVNRDVLNRIARENGYSECVASSQIVSGTCEAIFHKIIN